MDTTSNCYYQVRAVDPPVDALGEPPWLKFQKYTRSI